MRLDIQVSDNIRFAMYTWASSLCAVHKVETEWGVCTIQDVIGQVPWYTYIGC